MYHHHHHSPVDVEVRRGGDRQQDVDQLKQKREMLVTELYFHQFFFENVNSLTTSLVSLPYRKNIEKLKN